jgi:glycosyltransferase involved in cell wall biosynthesis
MSRSPLPISLCMIVKNEQKHLARCLESVQDLVNEMIIVDTGSTDKTVEIAKSYGAQIYHHEWANDFAKARNASIEKATNPWILQLDADEELIRSEIDWFYRSYPWPDFQGFRITINNLANEDYEEVFIAHQLIRFFRNSPSTRYQNRIHEVITFADPEPNIGVSAASILHKGYGDESASEKRKNRNRELLLEELKQKPDDANTLAYVAQHYGSSGELDKAVEYAERALDADVRYPLRSISLRFIFTKLAMPETEDEFEERAAQTTTDEFPELHFYRGLIAQKEENWEEAANYYRKFLEKAYEIPEEIRLQIVSNDNLRNAYLNLAAWAAKQGENLSIIDYLQKAADISPTFYKLKADLGERYLKVGNISKAYETFELFKSQLLQLGTDEDKKTWLPICDKVLDQLKTHLN